MGKKKPELTKIAELETKVSDLENQLKRALADYRNLESRVSEGRSELTNFVGAELIRKLLPVLDHLEQALEGIKESEESRSQSGPALSERSESKGWAKGVEMAVKEFKNVLQSEGLEEIDTKEETLFDPSIHEAVDLGEGPQGMILKVVRKGYTLNGKLLRSSQVVVGKYTSSEEAKIAEENKGENNG